MELLAEEGFGSIKLQSAGLRLRVSEWWESARV